MVAKLVIGSAFMTMTYVTALLDLLIQAGESNTGRVYSGSGKIRVGCISGSGKIWAGVFWFYGFRINPSDLERLFYELFFLCKNKKFCIFIN